MLPGYARLSTDEQDIAALLAALKAVGVNQISMTKRPAGDGTGGAASGAKSCTARDVVAVWKLDRLSRSLRDLLHVMDRLGAGKTGIWSLIEAVHTTTPTGRMTVQLIGASAQFERDIEAAPIVLTTRRSGIAGAERWSGSAAAAWQG
uniref:recombinase family protein n=1 Tax=Belnapia moabensis TaxID=365533 RepID=UPI0012ED8A2B